MSIELNGTSGVTFNDGSEQSVAAYPPHRNLIINGDMRIAQRGTSATGLGNGDAGYHTVDRWAFYEASAPTCEFTQSQDTNVPSGQGFSNSLKLECTTAQGSLAAGDYVSQRYKIEAQNLQHLKYGTSNAEKLTLSFWVKSNKTGTYIVEFYSADTSNILGQAYNIDAADTWEKKTITIDGDTSASIANDNGTGLDIYFVLAAGSSYTSGTLQTSWGTITTANRAVGQVNFADSTSNYINITGVQLEVGDAASDFEFVPFDMELARCQRYFWRWTDLQTIADAAAYSTTAIYGHLPFGVTMRTLPTMSVSNTSDLTLWMSGNQAPTAVAFAQNTDHSVRINLTVSTARTQGHAGWIVVNSGADKYIQADAEL